MEKEMCPKIRRMETCDLFELVFTLKTQTSRFYMAPSPPKKTIRKYWKPKRKINLQKNAPSHQEIQPDYTLMLYKLVNYIITPQIWGVVLPVNE